MRTDTDADLRKLFRELRADDDAAIPAFESLSTRAPAPARVLRMWPRLAWTAGGFALTTAAGLWLMLRPPAFDVTAAALPAWQTPTDSLLAGAGDPLQHLSWATLPTVELGRPSFSRYREDR